MRPLVRLFLRSKVGNGLNTSFWNDRWIGDCILSELGTEETPRRCGIPTHSSISEAFKLRNWQNDLIHTRYSDVKLICKTVIDHTRSHLGSQDDSWVWSMNGENRVSFSTAYTWTSLQPALPIMEWYKTVWFKGSIPRFAFISWLAMLNKLPVKERLFSWRLVNDPCCIFCGCCVETRDHVMLQCEYSEQVWRLVMFRLCALLARLLVGIPWSLGYSLSHQRHQRY